MEEDAKKTLKSIVPVATTKIILSRMASAFVVFVMAAQQVTNALKMVVLTVLLVMPADTRMPMVCAFLAHAGMESPVMIARKRVGNLALLVMLADTKLLMAGAFLAHARVESLETIAWKRVGNLALLVPRRTIFQGGMVYAFIVLAKMGLRLTTVMETVLKLAVIVITDII